MLDKRYWEQYGTGVRKASSITPYSNFYRGECKKVEIRKRVKAKLLYVFPSLNVNYEVEAEKLRFKFNSEEEFNTFVLSNDQTSLVNIMLRT